MDKEYLNLQPAAIQWDMKLDPFRVTVSARFFNRENIGEYMAFYTEGGKPYVIFHKKETDNAIKLHLSRATKPNKAGKFGLLSCYVANVRAVMAIGDFLKKFGITMESLASEKMKLDVRMKLQSVGNGAYLISEIV